MKTVSATAIAIAALLAVAAASAKDALPQCAWSAPDRGPSGLPATLSLETRCADFHLRPDGSLRPNGHGIFYGRAPRGSIGFADGSWWQLTSGRLAAHRSSVRLWRSSRRYPRLFELQGAAVRASGVAFTYRRRLYVAVGGYRAAEHPAAQNELPLGWSPDGALYTQRRSDVVLREADGTFLAVAQRRTRAVRYDSETGTLLTVTRDGRVQRFDGHSTTSLVRLRDLDLPKWARPEPLAGGLIGLIAQRRVAVLRADGSLFASATFPRGRRWNAAGNSGLVADETGNAVALTLTEGNTGYASRGAEWLLVLREGDRVARVLHRQPLRFAVCERWAALAWHKGWLLYSSTEGRTLVAGAGRGRVVDLTPLVARLPGAAPNGELKVELEARWA